MADENMRYIKVDDWYFEIKTIKAIKVNRFGEPYSATANCSLNGNNMYIDGLMTKQNEHFTKQDYQAFQQLSELLGIKEISYHRYKKGIAVDKEIEVNRNKIDQKRFTIIAN